MKKIAVIVSILAAFIAGCSTPKTEVSFNSVYPFEGHYFHTNSIVIDGKKAEIDQKNSVWLLSNITLYNLLVDVSGKDGKIVFKGQPIGDFPPATNVELYERAMKDSFEDEEYVWENWNVSTNRVKYRKDSHGQIGEY